MTEITKILPTQAPSAIASYSYTDIAEATGIQVFYAATTEDSTGAAGILTEQIVYSDEKYTEVLNNTGDNVFYKKIDLDFDLSPFNLPKTVEGTATFSVSWIVKDPVAGFSEGYIIIRVKKGDAEIASIQSETLGSPEIEKTTLMRLTIPSTHFKKGEILRVTVEGWARSDTVNNSKIQIFHDPKNRTGGTFDTTILQINMPFRLDDVA